MSINVEIAKLFVVARFKGKKLKVGDLVKRGICRAAIEYYENKGHIIVHITEDGYSVAWATYEGFRHFEMILKRHAA